jgi:hypothetical protein
MLLVYATAYVGNMHKSRYLLHLLKRRLQAVTHAVAAEKEIDKNRLSAIEKTITSYQDFLDSLILV